MQNIIYLFFDRTINNKSLLLIAIYNFLLTLYYFDDQLEEDAYFQQLLHIIFVSDLTYVNSIVVHCHCEKRGLQLGFAAFTESMRCICDH